MRIGDQHDNQQQCIQCRFVEERRLVPLPEFLYVNTIRKELEIWICDQISVSLLIHKIPPTPDGLSKNKAGNQRICKRPEGKFFDLAGNQYNSNTAEDASLFDAEHPIADSDVRLYVLLPVFSAFQLFAQGRHEHPQRSNIVFPTAAPNLLCDVGVGQNLAHIF